MHQVVSPRTGDIRNRACDQSKGVGRGARKPVGEVQWGKLRQSECDVVVGT